MIRGPGLPTTSTKEQALMADRSDPQPAAPTPAQLPTAPLPTAARQALARLERALRPAGTQ